MSPKPNFKGFIVFLSAVYPSDYPSDTEQRPQALAEQVSSQQ